MSVSQRCYCKQTFPLSTVQTSPPLIVKTQTNHNRLCQRPGFLIKFRRQRESAVRSFTPGQAPCQRCHQNERAGRKRVLSEAKESSYQASPWKDITSTERYALFRESSVGISWTVKTGRLPAAQFKIKPFLFLHVTSY